MSNGEQTSGGLIQPPIPQEGDNRPVVFTLEKRSNLPVKRHGNTYNYDSYAVFHDGQLADSDYWEKLQPSDLVHVVNQVSSLIEQNPEIKAFSNGNLNVDQAKGEEVLGYQYFDILYAISKAANSDKLTASEIGNMLDYVYDVDKTKPFVRGLTSEIFGVVMAFQREKLYQALATKRKGIAEANRTINKLPYGGIFLLDSEPTAADLARSFTQTEDEAEKNIIIDTAGRLFFVKGMNKNTGTITYKHFPDIVRDFHTHRTDFPFSTGDINTYKSLGASRYIYRVVSKKVDFFVCSPGGLFEFNGDLEHGIFDEHDKKTDSLLIPCMVTDQDTGKSARFLAYTNHDRGEAGQFIQSLLQGGSNQITISFDNGDLIKFTSWKKLSEQGLSSKGIRDIHLETTT